MRNYNEHDNAFFITLTNVKCIQIKKAIDSMTGGINCSKISQSIAIIIRTDYNSYSVIFNHSLSFFLFCSIFCFNGKYKY